MSHEQTLTVISLGSSKIETTLYHLHILRFAPFKNDVEEFRAVTVITVNSCEFREYKKLRARLQMSMQT